MAAEIDKPEDRLLERIARMSLALPPGVQRPFFNRCVAAAALAALRESARDGTLADLFDGLEPVSADLEGVARILAELIDSDNPRLQAKCMDFVLGTGLCQGKSQTVIALEEGVGKAAVSKRCKVLQTALGVPPGRGMKREEACASYRERQLGKRAKPKPQPWAFSKLLGRAYANA
jgi:hypothetical protein